MEADESAEQSKETTALLSVGTACRWQLCSAVAAVIAARSAQLSCSAPLSAVGPQRLSRMREDSELSSDLSLISQRSVRAMTDRGR